MAVSASCLRQLSQNTSSKHAFCLGASSKRRVKGAIIPLMPSLSGSDLVMEIHGEVISSLGGHRHGTSSPYLGHDCQGNRNSYDITRHPCLIFCLT